MTLIIAHRGYSAKYPENTLLAFQKALKAGAEGVELDVHITKDDELVVLHNHYINNIPVRDQMYKDIKKVDVGAGQHIPTLEKVLEQLGRDVIYEIELKGFSATCLTKVADTIQRHNLGKHTKFTSSYAYVIAAIKNLVPEAATGMFSTSKPDWVGNVLWQDMNLYNASVGNITVLHAPITLIDTEFIDRVHAAGLKIQAPNCNSQEELTKAFQLNVDFISTDEVEKAITLRNNIQQASI
jgi:glycerophosphoryl diester phosphodiesterase